MSERVIIFIIVAATIVAVFLIGAIVAMVRYVNETRQMEASALAIHELHEMGVNNIELECETDA